MQNKQKILKVIIVGIISVILGFVMWYFRDLLEVYLGGFDGLLKALGFFVISDYITGVLSAFVEKKLNSKIGFKGIAKKIVIFVLVGLCTVLDMYVFKGNGPIRDIAIAFYISNEGISIVENSAKIGLPVPQKLQDVLAQLKGKEEDKE